MFVVPPSPVEANTETRFAWASMNDCRSSLRAESPLWNAPSPVPKLCVTTRKSYGGETKFPFTIQNIHRYALYIALGFLVMLLIDVWHAFWFDGKFGMGVGTLVLMANVTLLGGYALGCHSMRHITGGYLDRLAKRPAKKLLYDCSSCLNRGHMRWAWFSLFGVGFADLYIRMCSMGIWHDWRLF